MNAGGGPEEPEDPLLGGKPKFGLEVEVALKFWGGPGGKAE